MSLVNNIAACQAQPCATDKSSAVFGFGIKLPQKPDLPRLSPRELALAVFNLLGSWGRADATIH